MKNLTKQSLQMLSVLILLSLTLTSCSKDDEEDIDPVEQKIQEIKESTSAYKDVNAAVSAGWSEVLSECVEHPDEGGMGFHYGRMEFFDGRQNHLEPQVMLFAPDGNGGLEFVGVEFIIPFSILDENSEPPVILGQEYHQNHVQEIWALHVWTEKENPKGIFFDWNPNVSCN
ncbi:MAG: hypothetical protein WD048_17135 [Chitinophagales bacterium]